MTNQVENQAAKAEEPLVQSSKSADKIKNVPAISSMEDSFHKIERLPHSIKQQIIGAGEELLVAVTDTKPMNDKNHGRGNGR